MIQGKYVIFSAIS